MRSPPTCRSDTGSVGGSSGSTRSKLAFATRRRSTFPRRSGTCSRCTRAARGKARYAEKTPINVLHIELLADVFPEARFIHLIRDGRDVALSYLDTDFGASSLPEAAVQWRRFVRKGRRSGARVGAHRYQEVRYEDLVADPDTVLRSLCEFIDLPFDPSMLRYHERAGVILRNTSHRAHHGRIALPPTSGLRDWRRDMDPRDTALFEALAGDLLEELGYERATQVLGLDVRLAAFGARLDLIWQRARRRIRRSVRRDPYLPRARAREGASSAEAAMTPADPARPREGHR